jgi:hypothetical protein
MTALRKFYHLALPFTLLLPVSLATLFATAAAANDYPTTDRVLFVQECMALENSVKYETLYACACTLDKIAAEMSYTEFIEADSYLRLRNMRGERGGLFRNSDDRARTVRQRLQDVKVRAEAQCFFKHSGSTAASVEKHRAKPGNED